MVLAQNVFSLSGLSLFTDLHAVCRVDEYINGEDDMPVFIDWGDCFPADLNANSDSSLPEDPPLQDFNYLKYYHFKCTFESLCITITFPGTS